MFFLNTLHVGQLLMTTALNHRRHALSYHIGEIDRWQTSSIKDEGLRPIEVIHLFRKIVEALSSLNQKSKRDSTVFNV